MIGRWAPPTRHTRMAGCWAIGITIATATYLGLIYPTLPSRLPVRYLGGEPIFFQLKTPLVVMLPTLVQAALLAIFGALCLLLLWRARPGHNLRDSADDGRMRLAVEGITLLASVWITVQAIGAARLVAVWQGSRGSFGGVYNVTLAISLLISMAVVWRTAIALRRGAVAGGDVDPALWRFTHLYLNPKDPALFVPTRQGIGWTLNFGRPLAIVLIAAILAVGVGGPFLLARSVLWDGAFVLLRIDR